MTRMSCKWNIPDGKHDRWNGIWLLSCYTSNDIKYILGTGLRYYMV